MTFLQIESPRGLLRHKVFSFEDCLYLVGIYSLMMSECVYSVVSGPSVQDAT